MQLGSTWHVGIYSYCFGAASMLLFALVDVSMSTLQVCGGETGTSNIHDFMALDTAERFSPLESWLTNMYRM